MGTDKEAKIRNLTAIQLFLNIKNPKVPANVAGWRRGSAQGSYDLLNLKLPWGRMIETFTR